MVAVAKDSLLWPRLAHNLWKIHDLLWTCTHLQNLRPAKSVWCYTLLTYLPTYACIFYKHWSQYIRRGNPTNEHQTSLCEKWCRPFLWTQLILLTIAQDLTTQHLTSHNTSLTIMASSTSRCPLNPLQKQVPVLLNTLWSYGEENVVWSTPRAGASHSVNSATVTCLHCTNSILFNHHTRAHTHARTHTHTTFFPTTHTHHLPPHYTPHNTSLPLHTSHTQHVTHLRTYIAPPHYKHTALTQHKDTRPPYHTHHTQTYTHTTHKNSAVCTYIRTYILTSLHHN